VVAVGTTVVRALESVVDDNGVVHPGRGLTDLVVTPDRGVRAVDGLLTGWHEPRSSHLTLLEAFLPHDHLQVVYDRALTGGYLWHEFGDELLILP
jgi:S-adenosylmethionine:tRNA ribosyltransferase-isomerase